MALNTVTNGKGDAPRPADTTKLGAGWDYMLQHGKGWSASAHVVKSRRKRAVKPKPPVVISTVCSKCAGSKLNDARSAGVRGVGVIQCTTCRGTGVAQTYPHGFTLQRFGAEAKCNKCGATARLTAELGTEYELPVGWTCVGPTSWLKVLYCGKCTSARYRNALH